MAMRGAILLAALCLAAPASAQEQVEPSYVLGEIAARAEMIGYPAVCPGTSPQDDQSKIICMAEMYEADVTVLRHLGGPATASDLRVRFTAHSFHAVWQEGVRFLLGLSPFENGDNSGHFAFLWVWEEGGEMCQWEENLDSAESVVRAFYESGPSRLTDESDAGHWSEGIVIHCAALD